MAFHTFNFGRQERLSKIPFLLFNPQNFQSLLYTATFCNFIAPMNLLEFCDRNVTALYPSVIILTSPFNLWITSFTTAVNPLDVTVFPILQIYVSCNFTNVSWNFTYRPTKRNPKKSSYVFEKEMSFVALKETCSNMTQLSDM